MSTVHPFMSPIVGGITLALWLAQADTKVAGRPYHRVPVAKMSTTSRTHVEVCGLVTLRRKQADGDWHIRLTDGKAFVIAEIIPAIPLTPPKKGTRVCVRGISRFDKGHGWPEVHPVEAIRPFLARVRPVTIQ